MRNSRMDLLWWRVHRDEHLLSRELNKPYRRKNFYHLVELSPHPFLASVRRLWFTTGVTGWCNSIPFSGVSRIMGLGMILFVMYIWWRDITRESTFQGNHTRRVTGSHKIGILWFIVNEIFFFRAFFWRFFHSALVPVVDIWVQFPPRGIDTVDRMGIPLKNTLILLRSGVRVTWRHKRILAGNKEGVTLGLILTLRCSRVFMRIQRFEYNVTPFTISDGIYGSTFYMRTGFHGFHVFVGSVRLRAAYLRHRRGHFTVRNHKGFEGARWYWHFVDVVWLFLFVSIYWWGAGV
jgi:heme/copper-type cytochrome/quinol oxidase subunit 3